MSQAKTDTVPEEERPGFPATAKVVGLRVLGSNQEILLPNKPRLSLGSEPGCDIVLPLPYISRIHCVIDREGDRLVLRDRSKNGAYFAGQRRSEGELADGTVVILGTTPLIAFSERHRSFREALQWHLGWAERHQQGVDQSLSAAASDGHLLLVAAEGLEPEGIARVIHERTVRAARPLVEVADAKSWRTRRAQREVLDRAEWSDLCLPAQALPDDPGFVLAALGSASFHVRLFAAAQSRQEAVDRFGLDLYTRMLVIDVPPLADRSDDVARLGDDVAAQGAEQWGGVPVLMQADRVKLAAHTWPQNLAELRRIMGHLAVLARDGSLRQAAKALGITRQTLENRLDRIGLDRTAPRAWVPTR